MVILLASFFCSVQVAADGVPGSLDLGFGNEGKVILPIGVDGSDARSLAIQSDGKILVAGSSTAPNGKLDFTVARLTRSGLIDTAFGQNGTARVEVSAASDYARDLVVQGDGTILVAGYSNVASNADFVIVKLRVDGQLDSSFGTAGIVSIPMGTGNDQAYVLALRSDGRILIGGFSNNGVDDDMALVSLLPNGSLDPAFGQAGKLVLPVGPGDDHVRAMTVMPDGRIMVAGTSFNGTDQDFALVRLNADGTLDASFGAGGQMIVPLGGSPTSNDRIFSLLVQPDGKIVAGGHAYNGRDTDFALVRLLGNGAPDPAFAEGGRLLIPVGEGNDYARDLALAPDGKIVIAGYTENGLVRNFAVFRLHADGRFDTSFGDAGRRLVPMGGGNDLLRAVAMQHDGNLLLAGLAEEPNGAGGSNFALARLYGESFDLTPLPFSFAPLANVPRGSVNLSHAVSIQGLGEGVSVPVRIQGGEYALNGGTFTAANGWVRNGDQIVVRQVASQDGGTLTRSLVVVGGMLDQRSPLLNLGGISAPFETTTEGVAPGSIRASTGGGLIGGWALMLVALLGAVRYGCFRRIPSTRD
ncbi:MAG: delta-60 repeat domain-containing protein [Thiotrichales bacterium]